jgi:hypothetical protein
MCLLTYFPEGVQPDLEALIEGARSNRDGYGYAIVVPDEKRIIINKSMTLRPLLEQFQKDRKIYAEGPALFHCRLGTDGTHGKFNVHPFEINHDPRVIMAHNGVFGQARPALTDPRSDTRIVAESFARKFKLRTERGRKRFGRWMGDYNKVVILTVDPSYDRHGYIINEDRGIWDKGIWYSNSSYQPWVPTYSSNWMYYGAHAERLDDGTWFQGERGVWHWEAEETTVGGHSRHKDAWLDCANCEKLFCVNPTVYRCVLCHTCQMCYLAEAECICWLNDMKDTGETRPITDIDLDRLIAEYEAAQEERPRSKDLVPLGATVSQALSVAHEHARRNHADDCSCEWCVIDDGAIVYEV